MPDAFVQTTRMRSIVEHDAANLTATVQAGLTIGELQKRLAAASQFLPLDAPPHATLGGIAASALSGPRRHIYGAIRDLALGLKFVTADGHILTAGGKTVKNVAGYDLAKMLIGSWGKLGIIAEMTFRLMPLPNASGAFIAAFDKADKACTAAAGILDSKLNPAVVTLMNTRAASRLTDKLAIPLPPNRHALVLGAEGFVRATERQLAEMGRICKENSAEFLHQIADEEYGALIDTITGLCYAEYNPRASLSTRTSVPCGNVFETLERIRGLETECGMTSIIVAHIAGGLVYSHFSPMAEHASAGSAEHIIENVGSLFPCSNTIVLRVGGSSTINLPFITGNRAPPSWLRSIERCFDPENLMNPGIPPW
jgi:FAD/FMN-containing dehydrogenase